MFRFETERVLSTQKRNSNLLYGFWILNTRSVSKNSVKFAQRLEKIINKYYGVVKVVPYHKAAQPGARRNFTEPPCIWFGDRHSSNMKEPSIYN